MKLQGQTFAGPNVVTLVLLRGEESLVFQTVAVLSFDRFDKLCVMPKPKTVTLSNGDKKMLFDDKSYTDAVEHYTTLKTNFLIYESLKATPGLEWDTITDDNPDSWGNYQKELEAAFFAPREINRIVNAVWEANGIDEDKLKQARERFLAGRAEASKA